jgi:glutaminyl-tRNA synthetase
VNLYDRLFTEPQPEAGGRDFREVINPHSLRVASAWVEPSMTAAPPELRVQFERHGYFVTDRGQHTAAAPVFNRITTLKDSWAA